MKNTVRHAADAATGTARTTAGRVMRSDTGGMSAGIERHHWVSTIVGILDGAFALTDEEQFLTAAIVRGLLDRLDIPGRGQAAELPVAVTLEATGGVFSSQLAAGRPVLRTRSRVATHVNVALEDWRDMVCRMIFRAYPNLAPEERFFAVTTIDEMLMSLGLPDRAPAFIPADVVSVYSEAR